MQVTVNSQDLTEGLTKRSTSRGPSTFDFDESNWGQRQPCRRPPRTNQLATLLVKHIKHFTTEHDATRGISPALLLSAKSSNQFCVCFTVRLEIPHRKNAPPASIMTATAPMPALTTATSSVLRSPNRSPALLLRALLPPPSPSLLPSVALSVGVAVGCFEIGASVGCSVVGLEVVGLFVELHMAVVGTDVVGMADG